MAETITEITDRGKRIVGVGVSASGFNAVCIDDSKTVIATKQAASKNPDDSVGELINFIRSLRDGFGKFDRIGIALPGLIHRETNRVAYSSHIPSHVQKDLIGDIKSATGLTALIENDANSAAFGEYTLGAGRGSRHMFFVTLGAGVGGALIIDGRLWHGAAGFAGEFGYVTINSDGMRLEDVASAANIVRRTRNRFYQDNTSSLNSLDEQGITIDNIISSAENEDDFARLMLERTGNYAGMAIASVINLLNIEKIVVSGEIMRAGNLILNSIIDSAREFSFAPSFESTEIVQGELGNDGAAIGAALLAESN